MVRYSQVRQTVFTIKYINMQRLSLEVGLVAIHHERSNDVQNKVCGANVGKKKTRNLTVNIMKYKA